MTFKFSKKSKRNREGIDTRLIEISDLALKLTKVDFGIPVTGGFRTATLQNQLHMKGVSMADGFNKRSKHQDGEALDFFAFVDGKASWKPKHLSMVACAVLQAANDLNYKLEWGGLWTNFEDMPHVQIKDK